MSQLVVRSTVESGCVAPSPGVDAERWPDVARVPRSFGRAHVARAVIGRVARRLPIQVELPDGSRLPCGRTDTGGEPVLILHRPDAFYRRVAAGGLIGFGEAYQAGDWDCADLVGLVSAFADGVETIVPRGFHWLRHVHGPRFPRSDSNTVAGSRRNIHRHYDLSNELFATFLDETMSYSAAWFAGPDESLADAQRRKIDGILDMAGVGPDMHVLEIGTGWGELATRAARRGARVTTLTLSTEQARLAEQRVSAAAVAERVQVLLRDYREAQGAYDAVVSVEMIEAVGERYWPTYFAALDRLLKPGGRVGLQSITMPHDRMLASRGDYSWMHKYVFPGGLIPSVESIEHHLGRETALRVVARRSLGPHYARTLQLWRESFLSRWETVAALGFDSTFRRMWEFYLAYCEAGFRVGYLDVYQFSLAR
jgi:cyclopropane-fatty-acyl-phospholipid synthase